MKIIQIDSKHFSIIRELAYQIWPHTYGNILSEIQLNYMLEKFYCDEILLQNIIEKHHLFYIIQSENKNVGFFSIENNYKNQLITRIHKLYLLPETQGKGYGKKILGFIENLAKEKGTNKLSLNVNRYNAAQNFYHKMGFNIILEEDIKLDYGYLMEDYLMEKNI